MKRALSLYLILLPLLLPSCTPAQTPQSLLTSTSIAIELQPTSTVASATATLTVVPQAPTSTPEICDPLLVDYCISDGHFIFQRPIQPPANTSIDTTYRYASTSNGARDPHHGVEFLNRFGTPVYASGEGVVLFAGPDEQAVYSPGANFYGNLVIIQHTDELYTLYAHLSKINVAPGQEVIAGMQIGEVGQSGAATGSHLHFEVRQGNPTDYFATQNPELWLIPNVDESGALFGAIQLGIQNQEGQLVSFAEVTLQQSVDQNQLARNILYAVTYEKSMLLGQENLAMGDLPAGKYRIAMQYNGQLRERWVEVQSGKLTQVVFVVK
jgi:hypothetical protein